MANNYNSNQIKSNCSGNELRRNSNEGQSQNLVGGNENTANILLPVSQGTSTNHLLNYQSTSFSSLYGSTSFNSSLSGYETNLQWLSDNRIQNQHNQLSGTLINDKNLNPSTHSIPPTTSHSCCVNKFNILDSVGMSSPIQSEQVKSACDISNFQNKTNISMNMIDPIQTWLNFQIPSQMSNNQQYCKYNDRSMTQNYNIPVSMPSQLTLPIIDQSDLKQNDMCIQSPDGCFESINMSNNKHIDNNAQSVPVENRHGMTQETSSILKQQGSYQSGLSISKDWKSTFQAIPMQNYIPSPNIFSSTVNEPQENYIFPQYGVPSTNSYYSSADNYTPFINKSSSCSSQTKIGYHESSISVNNSQIPSKQFCSPQSQVGGNINQLNFKQLKDATRLQTSQRNKSTSYSNHLLSDCCQLSSSKGKANNDESNKFSVSVQENVNCVEKQNITSEHDFQSEKRGFKSSDVVSSESDESNIIVEESDDIGEIESEISIEEIKKTYQNNEKYKSDVLLRCLVCNAVTSAQTPANHFIHMNDSFPLTTASKIPVRSKLEQILPMDLQQYLKLHNTFMCRRCLNLIETVEVLEVKLITAKKTISDSFTKTVQQIMPEVEHLFNEEKIIIKTLQVDQDDKNTKSCLEMEITIDGHESDDNQTVAVSEPEVSVEFKCSYCSKILFTKKTYNLHLQQHTKEFTFYCERCGKGFPKKSNLQKHLLWHDRLNKDFQILCEICGDTFLSVDLFYSHQMKTHSINFNFKCDICGKGFSRKVSLDTHIQKHTGVRTFICEYCGLMFTSQANLKVHIKVCTRDLPYKCDECERKFALESQLTRHKSQHNGIYKLCCSVCGKGFNKPSDLSYHMLSHSSEKQFKCPDCNKAFKTQGNLNYHSKVVHKEEKHFKCSICGKSFFSQTLLTDHMNTHNNEKPFKCDKCEKNFKHQTTFITHLKVHRDKVKVKICDICGKTIKTRMSVHMRTHTGERPYKCDYCPLAFTVGISLKKHIELKHSKS